MPHSMRTNPKRTNQTRQNMRDHRVVAAIALVGTVLGILLAVVPARWRRRIDDRLRRESSVVHTTLGPVEYAEQGSGDPVLILHGSPGGYNWSIGIALLLGDGLRLIAPSRPGYLRTPLSTGRSFEQQADAMAALLDHLNIERVAVIGASGGGPVAIHFASRHRERISCLILWEAISAPIPNFSIDNLSKGPMLWNVTEWLLSHVAQTVAPLFLPAASKKDACAVSTLRKVAASGFPIASRKDGMKNDAQMIRTLPALPLSNLAVRTLLVHGTADTDAPYKQSEVASTSIPSAQLISIPEGTHITSLVDLVAREAIQHFLRSYVSTGDRAT